MWKVKIIMSGIYIVYHRIWC